MRGKVLEALKSELCNRGLGINRRSVSCRVVSDRHPALWCLTPGEGWTPCVVWVNCEKSTTTEVRTPIKAIWAKGRLLDDSESVP